MRSWMRIGNLPVLVTLVAAVIATHVGLGRTVALPGPCLTPKDYPAGWEALAKVESGGRWHIEGRYSGGLQFAARTWRAFRHCAGASDYARASHAPKEVQIQVARFVLAAQGVCAWPLSSYKLGVASCGYA